MRAVGGRLFSCHHTLTIGMHALVEIQLFRHALYGVLSHRFQDLPSPRDAIRETVTLLINGQVWPEKYTNNIHIFRYG